MRNPRLYAAAYQCNPRPESMRHVQRLAYYDPTAIEHEDFLSGATFYLSIDPAATNTSTSDSAGVVYAALGDLTDERADTRESTRRLRILSAETFKASHGEAVDWAVSHSRGHRVDEILWESRGATSAGPEMLEREYGLSVTIMDPGNRDKIMRLKDVAPVMDAALKEKGLPDASVEFPGKVRDDGTIGPDPDLDWFYQQILHAGVAAEDHALDATTQLVKRVMPELRIGMGTVTEAIMRNERRGDPRIREFLRHALGGADKRPVSEQDFSFCAKNMGNRMAPMMN